MRQKLLALILYVVCAAVMYAPVVFSGKSLVPSLYQPHGVTAEGAYVEGHRGRLPATTLNVDIATPAYYEFPVNALVGRLWADLNAPLWNPYQSAGAPLLAQYSTRAFFPYQIAENLSPAWAWDFFLLGRLVIAGFFTYLFLSSLGLSHAAAFCGGLFYIFSGTFGWFLNLEQMSNVAMSLPVVMYAMEVIAKDVANFKRGGFLRISFAGFSFMLLLTGGQPEVALYCSLLAVLFFALRAIDQNGLKSAHFSALKIILAYVVGLALSAPLILPFLELVSLGHHIHPEGSSMGTVGFANWQNIYAIINPTATELPAHAGVSDTLVNIGGEYFRFMPTTGVWDSIGGYTGVLAIFLILTGLISAVLGNRGHVKYLLFFTAFGVGIILKHLNVEPFMWLGELPLFERVWSLRWAGPSWTFALACAGAVGFQAIASGQGEEGAKKGLSYVPALLSFLIITALYVSFPGSLSLDLLLGKDEFFVPLVSKYVLPSIFSGSIVVVLTLILALVISVRASKTGGGALALIALAFFELWWAVPRGYDAEWLFYKWAAYLAGLFAVLFFALDKKKAAIALCLAFVAIFLVLDALSPRGLPTRRDPFASPPYAEFIKNKDPHSRATGLWGVLYPNTASAIGLNDVKYIASLATDEFHHFRSRHMHAEYIVDEPVSSLWFTGRPERKPPGKASSAKVISLSPELDVTRKLKAYSMMGVRYFILPKDAEVGSLGPMPVVYDSEVRIFENDNAFPRAFVVHDYEVRATFDSAQSLAMSSNFDISKKVVLEEELAGFTPSAEMALSAKITRYEANRVSIEARTESDGILVLSDSFYPGWNAKVNGTSTKILRANGVIRAVPIKKGVNLVEFSYLPASFAGGVAICVVTIVILGILCIRPGRAEAPRP